MKLELDPNDLTIGDLEDFETHTGMDLVKLLDKVDANGKMSDFSMKQLAVFIWIVERKTNENYTLDDARRVKLSELDDVNLELRPTPAAGSPS